MAGKRGIVGEKERRVEIAIKFGLPHFMKMEELTAFAECSERHIMEEIKRKNLRAYKPVRELLFDPKDVQTWLRRKSKTA